MEEADRVGLLAVTQGLTQRRGARRGAWFRIVGWKPGSPGFARTTPATLPALELPRAGAFPKTHSRKEKRSGSLVAPEMRRVRSIPLKELVNANQLLGPLGVDVVEGAIGGASDVNRIADRDFFPGGETL